jgi:hypothetical protein
MESIARTLPWRLMSSIAGFPKEDIPRVARLIAAMGNFVGRPLEAKFMQEAIAAHREMRGIIQTWVADMKDKLSVRERCVEADIDISEGAIPYWIAKKVCGTRYTLTYFTLS